MIADADGGSDAHLDVRGRSATRAARAHPGCTRRHRRRLHRGDGVVRRRTCRPMTGDRITLPEPAELRDDVRDAAAAHRAAGPGAGGDDADPGPPARPPRAVPRLGGRPRAQRHPARSATTRSSRCASRTTARRSTSSRSTRRTRATPALTDDEIAGTRHRRPRVERATTRCSSGPPTSSTPFDHSTTGPSPSSRRATTTRSSSRSSS